MALELVDLQMFLAAAAHGSFSRAAPTLRTSQPTVSERVAHLERVLGRPVFARHARGVELTAAGERLLPYARRCVELAGEAEEAVREASDVPRLRVAVHSTFAHRAVPLVLDALAGVECRIVVRDAHSEQILEMLIDGASDVGFVLPDTRPRSLSEVPLRRDPVVCALAPGTTAPGRGPLRVTELARMRLAVNAWGDGTDAFLAALRDAGAPEENIGMFSDARTATLLALHYGYAAIVTESSVEPDVRRGDLVLHRIRGHQWTVPLACTFRTSDAGDDLISRIVRAARASTPHSRS